MTRFDYRDKTALITGASSGIGEAFAHQLAARGMHLILVARSQDKLLSLADALGREHGCRTKVLVADLSDPDQASGLADRVKSAGLQADLIINNAGFGTHGRFTRQSAAQERREVLLNALAPLEIAHAFVPGMVERGGGAIINVASSAGFQATPYMSTYGATKAFLLHLSEGLWAELEPDNIQVMAVCPGPVATNFFEASGSPTLKKALSTTPMISAERCVRESLEAFDKGRPVVVPGLSIKLMTQSGRVMPHARPQEAQDRMTDSAQTIPDRHALL